MSNRSEPRKRHVFAPERRRGHRRHPLAAALVEVIDPDSFNFAPALMELARMERYGVELTPEIVRKVGEKFAAHRPALPAELPQVTGEVVYYARIGNRIKIGTSRNLESRMAAINPEELMATERGGAALEHARHVQFRHLHTHGEWFEAHPILLDHIDGLRT